MELTGIVTSDPQILVRYGQTEVGRVHPVSFRSDHSGYVPILLGGRNWRVTRIDWRRGFADVVPDSRPGRSRWNGDARSVRGELCREMRACLGGSDIPARLTRRGNQTLEELREELSWAEDSSTAVVTDERGNRRWWTFAGLRANAELADRLGDLSREQTETRGESMHLASRPDIADAREAEAIYPEGWWGIVVFSCFGSLTSTLLSARQWKPGSVSEGRWTAPGWSDTLI